VNVGIDAAWKNISPARIDFALATHGSAQLGDSPSLDTKVARADAACADDGSRANHQIIG